MSIVILLLRYKQDISIWIREIEADGEASVDVYNAELKELGDKSTWFTAPWLFAE